MSDSESGSGGDGSYEGKMETDCGPLDCKLDVISFIVGVVGAVVMNVGIWYAMPTDKMRYVFGSTLLMAAVGGEYVGAALMQESIKNVVVEILIAFAIVPALVLVGMAYETPLVAVVWFLHPIYDLLHHPRYFKRLANVLGCTKLHPKQGWYPAFCAGIDFVQGAWILYHFNDQVGGVDGGLNYNLTPINNVTA